MKKYQIKNKEVKITYEIININTSFYKLFINENLIMNSNLNHVIIELNFDTLSLLKSFT